MRFGSLEALIHFSCMETRLFWIKKGGAEIPCFLRYFKACIFHKKTVNCTRLPLTERMTYPEMFHKNLEVSHDQILKYFLCSTIRSNQSASTSASSAAKNQPRESFQSKITFSLASVDMVNYSFLVFFARVTLNIVKLDRQFIG